MPFFDFHLHPTLKSLFSDPPSKLSPWEKVDIRKIPSLLRWCSDFEYILQSQANLEQLHNNEFSFVCIVLYVPEVPMLNNDLILGEADTSLRIYLNKQKIEQMISGQRKPYPDLVREDIDTLLAPGPGGWKVVPVFKGTDLGVPGTNIFAVFSIEGCHTLSSVVENFKVNEILSNLDEVRSSLPVISLNLTHLAQSNICNHAFGILFLESESFRPTGKGISAEGIQIIRHCYEKGILVDVKHMSLFARQQFYELRDTAEYDAIRQPLVCTHAGFTGIKWSDIPDYIFSVEPTSDGYTKLENGKPVLYGNNIRPSFNPSSINLYDDDIIEILQSGGMIGLSLDKRILGFQEAEPDSSMRPDFPVELEYISDKEKDTFFTSSANGSAFDQDKCITWEEVSEGGKVNPMVSDYHLLHFMAHILHLVVVAGNNDYDVIAALTQVCIGSDFDGIINPLWCCDTVDEMTYFRQAFVKQFELFAKSAEVQLPGSFNILQFADDLFYNNGKTFVLSRLKVLKQ